MKVLVVIENLGYGGAERLLVLLLPTLKQRGIECQVAALWPPYDLADHLESDGIMVHRLSLHHRWAIPEGVFKLVRLCRQERPTIVWGHLYFGTLYARFMKLVWPSLFVVSSLHSFIYAYIPGRSVWYQFREHLDRLTGNYLTDRFVAVSHTVAENYGRRMRWADIKVIYNGVAIGNGSPVLAGERESVRSAYGVRPDEFLIVLPGRHTEEKGHRYLIHALKLLKDRQRASISLIAPGQGSLRSELVDLAQSLDLSDTIQFIEPLPQRSLFALIQASDAVVMPSLFEGLSMAATEAMALGAAVVFSAIDSFLELAVDGRSALLVPPRNPEALAAAIWRLYQDAELRSALGRCAQQRVRKQFDIEGIACQWAEELASLVPLSSASK